MLKGNTTLQSLSLSFNEIGGDGGSALAEALTSNTTLLQLYVLGNYGIQPNTRAKMKEHLLRNQEHATTSLRRPPPGIPTPMTYVRQNSGPLRKHPPPQQKKPPLFY